jgi:hypothetical protein
VARFLGIRAVSEGSGVMLAGGSVHGFGLQHPLFVIGIRPDGRVADTCLLGRNEVRKMRGAVAMIELPLTTSPTLLILEAGDRLRLGRVPSWQGRSTFAQRRSATSATSRSVSSQHSPRSM